MIATPVSNNVIEGGCLCGQIRFEITSRLFSVANCYCSVCRRQHGTAFSTYCRVGKTGFHVKRGESKIRWYASSDFVERSFCINCGTKLTVALNDIPKEIWVSAGALEAPNLSPECNIFVGSKASWHEINDDLVQHDGPPGNFRCK